ncbi:serine-type peptidase [Aureococcus anophagefferens]|nr:serine-type peptidase [Aureococcus anophagefferens]
MSSLVAAVRETIVIGGENANRGSFVASILAAAGGEVPDARLEQTARRRAPRAPSTAAPRRRRRRRRARRSSGPRERAGLRRPREPLVLERHGAAAPDGVAALRALYLATGGGGWTRNACWLNESIPVCWWDQVACEGGRVQQLRLASNNLLDLADNALAAPLPDAAAAIANATFVDVAGNDVACSPAVAAWVRSREFGFGC